VKKYSVYTHKIYYNVNEAIRDFMRMYDCNYEQAQEYLPNTLRDYDLQREYVITGEVEETKYKSICVFDIQEQYDSYWADYVFAEGKTYFGGSGWQNIPPLETALIPSEDEAQDYADNYVKNANSSI